MFIEEGTSVFLEALRTSKAPHMHSALKKSPEISIRPAAPFNDEESLLGSWVFGLGSIFVLAKAREKLGGVPAQIVAEPQQGKVARFGFDHDVKWPQPGSSA
jgi:hypothetical protein